MANRAGATRSSASGRPLPADGTPSGSCRPGAAEFGGAAGKYHLVDLDLVGFLEMDECGACLEQKGEDGVAQDRSSTVPPVPASGWGAASGVGAIVGSVASEMEPVSSSARNRDRCHQPVVHHGAGVGAGVV